MTRCWNVMVLAVCGGCLCGGWERPTLAADSPAVALEPWTEFSQQVQDTLQKRALPSALCHERTHTERLSPHAVGSALKQVERFVVHNPVYKNPRAAFPIQLDHAEVLGPRWVWLLATDGGDGWKISWITTDRGAVRAHLHDAHYSPSPVPPPASTPLSEGRKVVEAVTGLREGDVRVFLDPDLDTEQSQGILQWVGFNLRNQLEWVVLSETVGDDVASVRVSRWDAETMVTFVRDLYLRLTEDGWRITGIESVRTPRLLERSEIRGIYAELGTRWVVETKPGHYRTLSSFDVPALTGEAGLVELAVALDEREIVREQLLNALLEQGAFESRHDTLAAAKEARDCRSSFTVRKVREEEWVVLDGKPAYTDPRYRAAKDRISAAASRIGWQSHGSHVPDPKLILGD